ncbi:MAG: DUF4331 domain-containing protein [Planctomycetota bacterium]|nr:DUF4331 domain-containing protein [Planctomycetota bacterium]
MRSRKKWFVAPWLAVVAVLFFCTGADHREAPAILLDPAADINDIYAFVSPEDSDNVILVMTVNPFTAPGLTNPFSNDTMLQFKIDNDGDFREDVVIQALFTGLPAAQQFTILGPDRPGRKGGANTPLGARAPSFSGPANGTIQVNPNTGGVLRVFAGMRDDPFFFDGSRFNAILAGTQTAFRDPGIDFFGGVNITALVLEVPADSLTNGGSNTDLNIWGATNRRRSTVQFTNRDSRSGGVYVQVDRMGRPAISTALIPSARRNEFNRAQPSQDRTLFFQDVAISLTNFGAINPGQPGGLAEFLLPDVLNLDTTQATSAFPNGRAPADDVIDTVLTLATNNNPNLNSDNLDAPAETFLAVFPFLAAPIPATVMQPIRQ